MNGILLAEWKLATAKGGATTVIPDGCRDLIMRVPPGGRPQWFVSRLEAGSYEVALGAGVFLQGFRLRPGARIDEARLLASVQGRQFGSGDIGCRLASFSDLAAPVTEALGCLTGDAGTVAGAARELGVSLRSLQRLLIRETARPPIYWLRLARLRKSARAVLGTMPLAEVAARHGYADQAHMSRDFRQWLELSPSRLRFSAETCAQLHQPGYS